MTLIVKPLAWRTLDPERRFVGTGLGFTCEVALMPSGMWSLACAHASNSRHLSENEAKLRAQDVYDALVRAVVSEAPLFPAP